MGALNHPNLLTLHDVGFVDGTDGAGFKGRRFSAPSCGDPHAPPGQSHLFLTDGRMKILGFGLAKLVSPQASDLSTRTAITKSGLMLGTVGYMAAEQVRGQPADRRADIFAFGAVLYELLAGQRAVRGNTPSTRSAPGACPKRLRLPGRGVGATSSD